MEVFYIVHVESFCQKLKVKHQLRTIVENCQLLESAVTIFFSGFPFYFIRNKICSDSSRMFTIGTAGPEQGPSPLRSPNQSF